MSESVSDPKTTRPSSRNTLPPASNRLTSSLPALAYHRRQSGIGFPADTNPKPSHWPSFGDFWITKPSGRLRATGSGRLNPYRTKSSGPFSKCATLGSAHSAGKREARFASKALLRFREPARNAERAGRSEKATRKRSGRGMREKVMKPLNRRFQRPAPGAQDQTIRAMCQITGTVLAKFNEPLAWPGSACKYSEAVSLSVNLSATLSPSANLLSTPSLILFSASLRSAPLSDPSGA
jgi:hypothetical protein